MSALLKVSEVFDSVQGEGASAGKPATFLRLAHCNLRCVFCDTKYTWDFQAFRYEDEVSTMSVDELAPRLNGAAGGRLVITGGEPLVQAKALSMLSLQLSSELVVEVETNGTLLPPSGLLERVDQWNVSPKLDNSGESERARFAPHVLAVLRDTERAWLKLVVANRSDCDEAEALAERLDWPRQRVLLMPLAATRAEYAARTPLVAAEALTRKIGLSPRLHVELWDGRRGV